MPTPHRTMFSPRGAFDLRQARRFLASSPPLGQPEQAADGAMHVVFLRDDGGGAAGAVLRQDAVDGPVEVELHGGGDPDAVAAQVARIFSLDVDAGPLAAVARRDPLVADLLRQLPGLRPVLFATPYEAAAWAVLSARQQIPQAAGIRRALADAQGERVTLDGRTLSTFPPPQRLLGVHRIGGGQALERLRRLHAVAEAALDGTLDIETVREGPEDEARRLLLGIRGIGPYGAGLVLARASGRTDSLPAAEPRVREAAARAYALDPRDDEAFVRVAESWRPFRTWVSFLLRNAPPDGPAAQGSPGTP
jgi:DNA-3-methyladenine glycosylase II